MTQSQEKGLVTEMATLTRATYNYYYQIQQEAFVVVRNWFDFVARGSNKELFQQQIPFIMASWKEKLGHL